MLNLYTENDKIITEKIEEDLINEDIYNGLKDSFVKIRYSI